MSDSGCKECGSPWALDMTSGREYCSRCKNRGYDRERLRDEFAIAALTGILAKTFGAGEMEYCGRIVSAPEMAFVLADSMLAARDAK